MPWLTAGFSVEFIMRALHHVEQSLAALAVLVLGMSRILTNDALLRMPEFAPSCVYSPAQWLKHGMSAAHFSSSR